VVPDVLWLTALYKRNKSFAAPSGELTALLRRKLNDMLKSYENIANDEKLAATQTSQMAPQSAAALRLGTNYWLS